MTRSAIFDLDGTLAHTAPDLIGAANDLLAEDGLPAMPVSAAESTAGYGAKAIIRKSYELAGRRVTEQRVDELYQPFLVRYAERIADESKLYDGVIDVLDTLAGDGWILAVCTNKPEGLAIALLEKLAVLDRFAALIGADTLPYRKPDPRTLFETIERAGGHHDRAVMIGDTDTDLKTARNAEIPCILTDFGYSQVPVRSLKPDIVVSAFATIPEALVRLTTSRNPA